MAPAIDTDATPHLTITNKAMIEKRPPRAAAVTSLEVRGPTAFCRRPMISTVESLFLLVDRL